VEVKTVGETEVAGQSICYIAMEFLEGPTLAKLRAGARLPEERVRRLGAQIADALVAMHACGIVHRDLKPQNVVVQAGDQVKVLDFGIAKLARAPDETQRTREGLVIGTPGYMAPEQQAGSGGVDSAADIYALGQILFECLTGSLAPPEPAAMRESLDRARASRPLAEMIIRMLAFDRAGRPNAAGVAAGLRAAHRSWRGPAMAAAAVVALTAIGFGVAHFAGGFAGGENPVDLARPSEPSPPAQAANPRIAIA